jgi:hypothetical protein
MNRRLGLFFVVLAFVAGCLSKTVPVPIPGVITLEAQTLPITKTLAWDADPVTDAVTNYTVALDGATVGQPSGTTQAVTFATQGLHTITVTATNVWGVSSPSTLTVNVKLPTTPANAHLQ